MTFESILCLLATGVLQNSLGEFSVSVSAPSAPQSTAQAAWSRVATAAHPGSVLTDPHDRSPTWPPGLTGHQVTEGPAWEPEVLVCGVWTTHQPSWNLTFFLVA